jgi:hypothetical protein
VAAKTEKMRAGRIALWARLYRVLSERPEYLIADPCERRERLLNAPIPMSEVDRTLILRAGELDRLCGHAVCAMRKRASVDVLHVLGLLDPDRIVAMHYALPENRRKSTLRDVAWAYHVAHAPADLPAALAEVEALVTDTQAIATTLANMAGTASPRDSKITAQHEREAMELAGG